MYNVRMQRIVAAYNLKDLMTIHWLSAPPKECDICATPIKDKFYDGRTQHGSWANMCHVCWQHENGRLGIGLAQRYQKQSDGKWRNV